MKHGRQPRLPERSSLRPTRSASVRTTPVTDGASTRERARYRLDNMFSRGPGVIVGWLAAVTLTLVTLAALLLAIFQVRINHAHVSLFESFWQSLLRVIDPGTMAGDGGWFLRLVALFVTISGIFLASALIGIVATGIDHKIQDLRRGRSFVVERGHTLVVGWSPRIFSIISEICTANESESRPCIVVLGPVEKPEMEEEIRRRVGNIKNTRVVCRTGEPASLHDLRIANAQAARSVIVLGNVDDPEGDADIVKATLAVLVVTPDTVPVVAEIADDEAARAMLRAGRGRLVCVRAADVIARITAQACRQSGLSMVCQDLLDFDGPEIYFQPIPQLEGQTFGDALLSFESSSVIGIRRADSEILINPPVATQFEAGDAVIAISEDDATVVFTGLVSSEADHTPHVALATRPVDGPQRILVVGWSLLGPTVLTELDRFVAAESTVEIVVDGELVDAEELSGVTLTNIEMHHTCIRNELDHLTATVSVDHFDHVVILAYRSGLTPAQADARTLLTLVLLRDAATTTIGNSRIVAEILDSGNVELAQATGADDFIVSDALSSYLISQLSENPELDAVFTDLFDAGGSAVGLKPADWYMPCPVEIPYSEIVAAARARGECAIGYQRASGSNGAKPVFVMNPSKSTRVALSQEDRVAVVGPPE